MADFRREYRIDLRTELAAMSWPEFCGLLAGLSVDSLWSLICRAAPNRLEGVAADRWFASLGA